MMTSAAKTAFLTSLMNCTLESMITVGSFERMVVIGENDFMLLMPLVMGSILRLNCSTLPRWPSSVPRSASQMLQSRQ